MRRYDILLCRCLNKVIKDELTAAILYVRLAKATTSPHIQKELLEHAKEEFDHFNWLTEFAFNRGYECVKACVDHELANHMPKTNMDILRLVQKLELIAARDYANLARFAMKVGDIEACDLFKKLMKIELEHYDDLNVFLGKPRRV